MWIERVNMFRFGSMSKLKTKEFEARVAHLIPALRKAYTSPDCFDLPFLCLIPGKKCWGLYLDVIVNFGKMW